MRTLFLLLWSVTALGQHFVSDRKVPITKVAGFNATDRYYAGDGVGPDINLTGFTVWAVVDATCNTGTSNSQTIISRGTRWALSVFQCSAAFVVDGTGAVNSSATAASYAAATSPLGEVGYLQVLHGVVRSNRIYLFKNGVATSDGLGQSKTSIDNASIFGISIGTRGNATYTPYEGGIISVGICATTGLTAVQVEAHYQALLSNINATPTGATHLWRGQDATATTWTDNISSLSVTKSGTDITFTSTTEAYYKRYDHNAAFGEAAPVLPQLPNTSGSLDILCVGDSHTIGGTVSYRMWAHLNKDAAGMSNLRFIGQGFDSGTPAPAGFGYYAKGGTHAGNCLAGDTGFSDWVTTLNTYDPDVIILWFGHNAITQSTLKDNLVSLVTTAHAAKPNCRFIILNEANYIREGGINGVSFDAKYKDYNIWLRGAVSNLKNQGIKVIYCKIDQAVSWDADADWAAGDPVHFFVPLTPYTSLVGYNKIGQAVWPAIRYICGYP